MRGICEICEQLKIVHKNRSSGKAVCHACYHKNPSTHEECSECGKVKPVAMRTEDGKAVCYACYYKNPSTHEKCSECGKVKPVQMRTEDGKAVCHACYRRSKLGKCAKCKETKIIQALGLCRRCYKAQRRRKKKVAQPT